MKRGSLAVAILLVALSVSGLAQQKNQFKAKPSHPEKASKSKAPVTKATPHSGKASPSASKDLSTIERQTAKSSTPSRSAKKTSGKGAKIKPVKDKPVSPIKSGGKSGGKGVGMTKQGSNPYRGRLKQKHAAHQ